MTDDEIKALLASGNHCINGVWEGNIRRLLAEKEHLGRELQDAKKLSQYWSDREGEVRIWGNRALYQVSIAKKWLGNIVCQNTKPNCEWAQRALDEMGKPP
jgi:hypothetical protein